MKEGGSERFPLEVRDALSPDSLHVRTGNVLVAVNRPYQLNHLEKVLREVDPKQLDVVVFSVNPKSSHETGAQDDFAARVVDDSETQVFSRVVHTAEKLGKPVSLVAVSGEDHYSLILQAAQKLRSSRVVIGPPSHVNSNEQQLEIRKAWQDLSPPRPDLSVEIVPEGDRPPQQFGLGSDRSQAKS